MRIPNCEDCKKTLRHHSRLVVVVPRSKVREERVYGFCMKCAEKKELKNILIGGLFSTVDKPEIKRDNDIKNP